MQETRHWDEDGGRTISGRSKEEAHDYRYFPEPDLVPVAPTDEMRARVRASMPELPAARRAAADRRVGHQGRRRARARRRARPRRLRRARGRRAEERARRRTSPTGCARTCSRYLNDRGLVAGGARARDARRARRPRRRRHDLARSGQGRARRVDGRGEVAPRHRRGARPRAGERRGRARRGRRRGARRERVDRRASTAPPTTTRPARRSATRSMGQVMRELKGKGNAQVVNQLLDDRLS